MVKNQKRKLLLILIAVTFLAYFSSLTNPFIWDDEQFITSNQYVQNFDVGKIFTSNTIAGAGITSNYYRPLTSLLFAIDAKMWSFDSAQDKESGPFGFHLTNLFFHILAGIFLFLFLLQLFSKNGETKADVGLYPAFFISLFFLIHPIQTEAVTYMNSLGDSMYAAFLFASLWLFVGVLKKKIGKWGIVGVFITFIASLLSKETALAGMGVYIVIFVLHVLSSRAKPRDLTTKNHEQISLRLSANRNDMLGISIIAGLMVIVGIYISLRLTIFNFDNTLNFYNADTLYTRSLAIRLFTFCKVLWIYLGLLLWPYPLHMERSVEIVKSFFSPWVLGMLGLLIGLTLLGIWEYTRKHTLWILVGLVWFVGMLVPASGIIPINALLYEHWLYVPMIGIVLSAYGIGQMVSFSQKNFLHSMLYAFVILLSILYIVLTIRQNNIWADPIVFYRYTLSFAPNSARLHNNLGMSLSNVGDDKGAIMEYKKALALGSDYPQIYNNLGNTEMQIGEYADAEVNLKKALTLAPQFGVAKQNLIRLYLLTKQFDKARVLSNNDPEVEKIIEQLQKIGNEK